MHDSAVLVLLTTTTAMSDKPVHQCYDDCVGGIVVWPGWPSQLSCQLTAHVVCVLQLNTSDSVKQLLITKREI